jgi:transposase
VGLCRAVSNVVQSGCGAARYPLVSVFNGLRYIVKSGNQWRMMPHDFAPWWVVYQQTRRCLDAGCFEIMVDDLRSLLREFAGRRPSPTAMILDSRTLQSTPESGGRAGYDGAKRRNGSKVHAAVDTLGHLLVLHVTAADEQDRARVESLAEEVQRITEDSVELAYVDQGYTGERAAPAAQKRGIRLEVVKHTESKHGFVLLPRRWVVERSFAWVARFRRLARDCERLSASLAGYHYFAFAWLMLAQLLTLQTTQPKFITGSSCLFPAFDGAYFSEREKVALWDRFYTGAPQRQRRSVERYNIVKRA